MSAHAEIRAEELHAYLDGEIDERRRAEIERIIESDTGLAAQVAAFRSDKETIARTYGRLIDRPLPQEWIARIERHTATRRRPFLPAFAALAASLVLLVLGTTVWKPVSQRSVVAEALSARDNSFRPIASVRWHPGTGFRAASDILAKTLAMRLRAPDLSQMGYSLAAIQVYPATSNGNSVELIYRGPRSQDFTLFVRRASGEPRFDVFERSGVRICLWQDDAIATVMAGRMSAAEMQRLASLAYNGLSA